MCGKPSKSIADTIVYRAALVLGFLSCPLMIEKLLGRLGAHTAPRRYSPSTGGSKCHGKIVLRSLAPRDTPPNVHIVSYKQRSEAVFAPFIRSHLHQARITPLRRCPPCKRSVVRQDCSRATTLLRAPQFAMCAMDHLMVAPRGFVLSMMERGCNGAHGLGPASAGCRFIIETEISINRKNSYSANYLCWV